MATMRNDGWCPFAEQLRITTGEFDDVNPAIARVSICEHITDGWDSRNWLQNVVNNASVHFLIRMEAGIAKLYQFISIFNVAYGNGRHSGVGNPHMPQWVKDMINRGQGINYATISVEHEGDYPTGLPFPEPMIQMSIALNKWVCSQIPTIVKDRAHIIGHYQVDHVDRPFCPGGPGGAQFPFDRCVAALNTPATPPENPDLNGFFKATGFSIGPPAPRPGNTAIGAHWRMMDNGARCGYPMTGEESGNVSPWNKLPELKDFTIQVFEYGTLGWRLDVGVVRVRQGAVLQKIK